jgi:hypothetical protein
MTEYRTQSSINQDYDLTSQVIYQSDEYTISDDHSYAHNIVSKLQSCDNSKIPLYTSEKQITSNFVPSSLNSEEVTFNCNPQDAAKFFNIPESLVMDIESLNTMVHRCREPFCTVQLYTSKIESFCSKFTWRCQLLFSVP